MRTTIILPDGLYEQVKDTARAADQTVTALLEEALRRELARRAAAGGGSTAAVLPEPFDGGAAGGVRSGIDIAHNASLLDLMEDELAPGEHR